jgi:phage shock protein C
MTNEVKKLYRSKTSRVFAGVCGGLGDYFGVDPVVIRVFLMLLVILSGFMPGVLAYIIAAFLIPLEQ